MIFRRQNAFTLVELLVVIGIIGLLISILIPTLGRARAQAAQVKCATQLREIYACFKQYELEHKGYWPVARINGNGVGTQPYNLNDFNHTTASTAQGYWFNFLAKYATKNRIGNTMGANNAIGAAEARRTIFYGCPSWEGYRNAATSGDTNTVQPGYGMNRWPTFSANYPSAAVSYPPGVETAEFDVTVAAASRGKFLKAKAWSRPTERMLIADSKFWTAGSNRAPALATYPPSIVPQPRGTNDAAGLGNTFDSGGNQTVIDLFRHGKYPPLLGTSGNYSAYGGRVLYNVLYCDGHVSGQSDAREAYRSLRMKFPG